MTMKDRVTLTLDPALVRRGKRLARVRHMSFSGLVADLIRRSETVPAASGQLFVERWTGKFRPAPADSTDPLQQALRRKYRLDT